MLAQLEDVPGIEEARVDWAGAHFLLRLSPGSDPQDALRAAAAVLGTEPLRLDRSDEAGHVAAFRRGEPWMRSGETLRMSTEEARVLGARMADETALEAGLDDGKRDSLREVFRAELLRAFERAHAAAGGGAGPVGESIDALMDRTLAACRRFLTEEETARVEGSLRRRFGGKR